MIHDDTFEIAGLSRCLHGLRQRGQWIDSRTQQVDIEQPATNQVEQAPLRVAGVHELSENLPTVEHQFRIGHR